MTPSLVNPSLPSPPPGKVSVAAYIFHRLSQLGIEHVLGVPGDFNLNLIDHLYTVPGLKWIGTCNELNAAYAADGYARIRGIPAALITTYGVGELSAINGIAGAYSEYAPIIHIVGTTSRLARSNRIMIHHTLDEDWDHGVFQEMSKHVSSGSTLLCRDSTFGRDIDDMITLAVKSSRPVYIYVPMDVPDLLVESAPLEKPLDLEIRNDGRDVIEDDILNVVLQLCKQSKKPAVLVDQLAKRFGTIEHIETILEITGMPAFVTPLAKSHIDETKPYFKGMYNGLLTPSLEVKDYVESADLVIHIGPLPSDSNTGGWTQNLPNHKLIILGHKQISVPGKTWKYVHFAPILKKFVVKLRKSNPLCRAITSHISPQRSIEKLSGPLDQHCFWNTFSQFLQPDDCIIAEVGTAQYGTLDFELPASASFFTQLYYSCIGFTVGALLGALIARREQGVGGRTILFIGDGSLQMTVQELSTIIRNGFNPIIVLINNSGYTIERVIHGPTKGYNDISEAWDYQNMLKFFGAKNSQSRTASTYEDLYRILGEKDFQQAATPQLLEVMIEPFDAPWTLTAQVNLVQTASAAQLDLVGTAHKRQRIVQDMNLHQSRYAQKKSKAYQYFEERFAANTKAGGDVNGYSVYHG